MAGTLVVFGRGRAGTVVVEEGVRLGQGWLVPPSFPLPPQYQHHHSPYHHSTKHGKRQRDTHTNRERQTDRQNE